MAAASLSTRVVNFPLSAQFGLLQLLPPTYWIGMGFLGLATVLALRERSDALILGTGVLLIAVIAGTPSLFEANPRYWDSYLHLGQGLSIQATGHLPVEDIAQYSANWPGTFLFDAILLETSGIPPLVLLMVYPFLAGGITFGAMFVFLRSTFPRSIAGMAAILSSLLAVWAQYHLSPQSLGFVLMLLILATMWRPEGRWRALSATLFVGLVVSHPTSTLVLLSVLVVLTIFGLLPFRKSPEAKRETRTVRRVTFTYGTTWFAWLYFHATGSSQAAETAIVTRIGKLISLPEATLNLATARTVENLYTLAPLIRLGSLALFGLLSLPALFLLLRRPESRPLGRFVFAGLLGPSVIAGADILGFGGQFYDRPLLFFSTLLPAICLTAFRGVRMPKIAFRGIVAVLVAASLASASTVYYQEAFNNVTDQAIATSQFLERVPSKSVVLDGAFPQPVWIPPGSQTHYGLSDFVHTYPTPLQNITGTPTYAVFDPTAQLWYRQWRGNNIYRFYDTERPSLTRIYDNGKGVIYLAGGG